MQVYNDEMYHFGIKGMKWGQHKSNFKKAVKEYGITQTNAALHQIHHFKEALSLSSNLKRMETLNRNIEKRIANGQKHTNVAMSAIGNKQLSSNVNNDFRSDFRENVKNNNNKAMTVIR